MDTVRQRSTFQYEPIPSGQIIRLLKLHPGVPQEPIHCSFVTADLDSEFMQYEAVSYAWGDPIKTHTIFCNGSELGVTRSLLTALQRFRHVGKMRILWADAVCINQGSILERNSQVRLMCSIYKKASCTLAWWGQEDDEVVQTALNSLCLFMNVEYPEGYEGEHPQY
jgi:hypothetical protein